MLDLTTIRSHFPAFDGGAEPRFFENAGGSFPCRQTTDALASYYRDTKVQPYSAYEASRLAGEAMDRSYERWSEALGVDDSEIVFGPSTSMNTYVLAHALSGLIRAGDDVIVTNQDHEANTGATRRMAAAVGAELREWRIDPETGLLDVTALESLVTDRTRLITFPHCSNIVGVENDAGAIARIASDVGAVSVVDGVSYAPHGFPDVDAIDCDVYLFSLYKCYSVHQGLMVLRNRLADRLPSQGHYFNAHDPRKRMAPAGPDHAQVAAAGAVLDYVRAVAPGPAGSLRDACATSRQAWQDHEVALVAPVVQWLDERRDVRLLGPAQAPPGLHRCPTIAFVPLAHEPEQVSDRLVERGIMTGWGDFYATRVLEGMGVDPARGVVRLSWVHYTSRSDIECLLDALDQALSTGS